MTNSCFNTWKWRGAALAWMAAAGVALETHGSTIDRDYRLGDNSALSTENGVANAAVGSGAGSDHGGFTLDHAGLLTTLPTFQDLEPFGAPIYVNVGAGGLARPGAAAGSLGVQFDGVDDNLRGLGLGNPTQGDDPYQDTISYNTLFTRAVQGWVRPTAAAAAGQRQRVVRDTFRFGISIVADAQGANRWALNTDGLTGGLEVVSSAAVPLNQWSHVMHYANGATSALYVNGIAVTAKVGGYYGNGTTTAEKAFVLGADVTSDGDTVTASNYFKGQLDDFQVLVSGNNASQTAGANYGAFNLGVDNQFIAQQGLTIGDVTGDGLIMGNGTGGANDDVKKFIANYRYTQRVNGVVVGDLNTRTQHADLNFDGVTDLRDWYILAKAHVDAGSLDIAALLASQPVPEPSTLALASIGVAAAARMRRRRA
ncbi:LamG-like jellyroll fold domain-containing protein [Lacipirellula parvula]|uniref:Ice-binding protein C-terminal domain-containing protein n=1 Tax=Lacipirellula parvula TaxID=2650471 RepID=A0A5K7XG22_9BACT|nr:LamG-like jellyroll fold domain-containing protein [Lacipirellula parvula]BBO33831.1 hypothetical protein PLANPX_3443 [Lacipirellula parvula]